MRARQGYPDGMATDQITQPENLLPVGICSLCGGTIAEVRKIGHWDDRDRGFGAWYSGRCAECDVDFRLAFERSSPGNWRIDAPDKDQLISVLTDAEIAAASARVLRFEVIGAKWQ